MSDTAPARAIVVGHADFATGIVSAVEQICGNGSMLVPLSSANLGAEGIEQMVRACLSDTGVRTIFTDLPAGSATMAVRRVQRSIPGLTVVAGTNLATLLDFVQQPAVPDENAVMQSLERGRAAMIAYRGTHGG